MERMSTFIFFGLGVLYVSTIFLFYFAGKEKAKKEERELCSKIGGEAYEKLVNSSNK